MTNTKQSKKLFSAVMWTKKLKKLNINKLKNETQVICKVTFNIVNIIFSINTVLLLLYSH